MCHDFGTVVKESQSQFSPRIPGFEPHTRHIMSFPTQKAAVPRHLLPAFTKCYQANTSQEWAEGLTPMDWQAINSGQPVDHMVVKAVANWIEEQVNTVMGDNCPRLHKMDNDKCYNLSKPKCQDEGMIYGKYVKMVIGKDLRGNDVLEYVHRLVTWLAHRYSPEFNTAMHIGISDKKACRTTKCINPRHLDWGTQAHNLQDYHHRRKRGGGAE